jgi:hypothetical protein
MTRIAIALLALLVLPCLAAAATPVSLQFLHPVATTSDPDTDAAVRLSLLWGRSGSVSILDLGLVAGTTSSDMSGLQGQLFHAGVGGDLRGAGLSLGLHRVIGDVHGIQLAGLAGWSEGRVGGLQASAALAYADGGLGGLQLGGLMAVSDGPTRWVQASSVATVAVGDFAGWQTAGFVSHANARLDGVQTALLNSVDEGHGVQLGAINLAREMSGLQLGFINVSDRMSGLPLGMINLQKGSPRNWLVYGTNLSVGNLGFRTDVNGWLSTVSVGYGDAQGDQSEAGTLAWHFGRRILGSVDRWLAVEVGWVHIMPDGSDDPEVNDRPHPAFQFRVSGEVGLTRRLAVWGAVGASSIASSYDEDDDTDPESDSLLAAGVVLR